MKKFGIILFSAILLISCNKNQKAVKTLDGQWKASKFETTGGEGDVTFEGEFVGFGLDFKMDFEGCKLKKDEWCKVKTTENFISLIIGEGNEFETTNQLYRVTDDGKTLETKDDSNDNNPTVMKIVELEDDFAKLTIYDDEDKSTTTLELKKQ